LGRRGDSQGGGDVVFDNWGEKVIRILRKGGGDVRKKGKDIGIEGVTLRKKKKKKGIKSHQYREAKRLLR